MPLLPGIPRTRSEVNKLPLGTAARGLEVWLDVDLAQRWLQGSRTFENTIRNLAPLARRPGVVGKDVHLQVVAWQPLHSLDDLSAAQEVFISSTTREVAGVESISPNWNYKPPGPITQTLDRAFREYVKSEIGN